jgi:hypothetical protein
MAFLIFPFLWPARFEPVLTERISELDSVLEPCSGMENGCEWRFHLPTVGVGGFLCVARFFSFRQVLRHELALGHFILSFNFQPRSMLFYDFALAAM